MPDTTLARCGALPHTLSPGRLGKPDGSAGLIVAEQAGLSVASIMVRRNQLEALADKIRRTYRLSLPVAPRRETGTLRDDGTVAFIWAGPGRWLVTGSVGIGLASDLVCELGDHAAVVDQTDAYCVLRLTGRNVRDVLEKGVAVDLHPSAFGSGEAALTRFGHVQVHMWQVDDSPAYELAVFRSFAASFWTHLRVAAEEFGCEVLMG